MFLHKNQCEIGFNNVLEIGNGGSLGIAICALMTGSKRYISMELENNFNPQKNLELLNEIFDLFENRMPIPDHDEFPQINLHLNDYSFPTHLITDKMLHNFLTNSNYQKLRENICYFEGSDTLKSDLSYFNNWTTALCVLESKIDYIFSRAVMEHVDDPKIIYEKLYYLLCDNGLMFHDVEFHSHGLTTLYNGHYEIPPLLWTIIRGKRKHFLNRLNPYAHLENLRKNKFETIKAYALDSEGKEMKDFLFNDTSIGKTIYGLSMIVKKNKISYASHS